MVTVIIAITSQPTSNDTPHIGNRIIKHYQDQVCLQDLIQEVSYLIQSNIMYCPPIEGGHPFNWETSLFLVTH